MLFSPKLGNGKVVPLTWPIAMYRYLNFLCWPLEDGASYLARFFDRFCYLLALFCFIQHNDAEMRYFRQQIHNLDQFLTGVPTYLILIEIQLRGFHLGWDKNKFKRFLQEFYGHFYISQSSEPKYYRQILRKLRPTFTYAALYFATLLAHLLVPILCIIYQRKDLLYKMVYPFDVTPMYIYVPILLTNIWVGVLVTTMIFGEPNIMSDVMLHMNGQYLLLREQLEVRTEALLQRNDATHIAREFRYEIVNAIKRNGELNKFAAQFHTEFSFRIFVMFAFSAALLCALSFKVYTNPVASYSYIFWMCGKILEMLAIGELGTTLINTTDGVSSMYYESKWEQVILRSSDTTENVRLMKLILLAIQTNQKPFFLTGLNFFSVSLGAVVTILQGAGSYFTCLISFR